jgi:hypothetical protein
MYIFAQNAIEPGVPLWANLTAIGLGLFLVGWLVTYYLPKIQREGIDMMCKINETAQEQNKEQAMAFISSIRECRVEFINQLDKLNSRNDTNMKEHRIAVRENTAAISELKDAIYSNHK